jgi:MFS family permease
MTETARPAPSAARASLWRDPNFAWLMGGAIVSQLGDQLTLFAMPWLVLKLTRDPLDLGIVLALFGVPRAVFILFGGAVTDQYSARHVLLVTKYVNALLLGLLGALVLAGALGFPALCALALAIGVASAFALPSGSAVLPQSVAPDRLQGANGVLMGLYQFSTLIGPLLAGVLVAGLSDGGAAAGGVEDAGGLGVAFLLDGVSFAISAWTLHHVRTLVKPAGAQAPGMVSMLRAIGAGLRYFWNDHSLRALCLYFTAAAFFIPGPARVALPVLADLQFGRGAGGFALLSTANGIGMLIGMAFSGALPRLRLGTLGMTILTADALVGLILLAFALVTSLWQAISLLVLMGAIGGYLQVVVFSWMQRRLPPPMIGRGMSLFMFMFMGVPPLAAALAGWALLNLSAARLFALSGAVLLLIVLAGWSSRSLRAITEAGAPLPSRAD